jgi:glucoamylase
MRLLSFVITALLGVSAVAAQDVDAFITKEAPIAKAGLLANIGPNGAKDQGAKAGVVIASPSKTDPGQCAAPFPPCCHSMVVTKQIMSMPGREVAMAAPCAALNPQAHANSDASLVFKALIDQYTKGIDSSASLRTLIDDFFASQKRLQQVPNKSGTAGDTGLGEPKVSKPLYLTRLVSNLVVHDRRNCL